MNAYYLSKTEIELLLTNNKISTQDGKLIEIDKDRIILNTNGKISIIHSMTIEFNSVSYEEDFLVEVMRDEICKYFNLEQNSVLFVKREEDALIFKIRFIPQKELVMIVCEKRVAILNFANLNDAQTEIDYNSQISNIGPYKQLGSTFYYFRWLINDFEY